MNRQKLEQLITEKYSIEPDYPWQSAPTFAVFRHSNNKKWFAVVMTITKDKLGFDSRENIDVVNLKCDQLLMGSVLNEQGIFPAYHMSKTHWISVALDGSAQEDKVKWLLDLSYDLTNKKIKKKKEEVI
jgi:predicted DNA-binding protein (MmcQ/YjbR family)